MGVKVRWIEERNAYYIYISHKKRRKATRVGPNKKDAEEAAKNIRFELLTGKFKFEDEDPAPPSVPTLREYFEKLKDGYLRTDAFRDSTRTRYETNFRIHILPMLGDLKLDRITREDLEIFIASLSKKDLAKPTIRMMVSELQAVLNHALQHKIITEHSAKKLSHLFKNAPVRHEEIRPLNDEEVEGFLTAIASHSPEYYCFFLLAIHTGLRAGELLGLKWSDVDFEEKCLWIKRNLYRGKEQRTKTDKPRRVDLSDAALIEVKEHRAKMHLKFSGEVPEWVFPNQNGNTLEFYNLRHRHYEKNLKRAGLPHVRFHDLRHTFASLMIRKGKSMKYVQQMLGHSSIKMTMDIYSHLQPGADRESLNDLPSIDKQLIQPIGKVIKLK